MISSAAAAYLRHKLPGRVSVHVISANNSKPENRQKLVDQALGEAKHSKIPVVIVSTYRLLGDGTNGLQYFMSFVVLLREPWTASMTQQAMVRAPPSWAEA
jgi:predicted kinase